MLNTFENSDRFHQRRLERQRHLENIEVFSKIIEVEDEDAVLSMADALSGFPLAKNDDPPQPATRSRKSFRTVIFCFIGFVVLLTISLFSLLGRMKLKAGSDVTETALSRNDRRKKLFSLLLDWGLTPRNRLEDITSPAAMALDWLVEEDIATENPEDIRTRFALAALYFGTQNASAGLRWTQSNHWLSPYRELILKRIFIAFPNFLSFVRSYLKFCLWHT